MFLWNQKLTLYNIYLLHISWIMQNQNSTNKKLEANYR